MVYCTEQNHKINRHTFLLLFGSAPNGLSAVDKYFFLPIWSCGRFLANKTFLSLIFPIETMKWLLKEQDVKDRGWAHNLAKNNYWMSKERLGEFCKVGSKMPHMFLWPLVHAESWLQMDLRHVTFQRLNLILGKNKRLQEGKSSEEGVLGGMTVLLKVIFTKCSPSGASERYSRI